MGESNLKRSPRQPPPVALQRPGCPAARPGSHHQATLRRPGGFTPTRANDCHTGQPGGPVPANRANDQKQVFVHNKRLEK